MPENIVKDKCEHLDYKILNACDNCGDVDKECKDCGTIIEHIDWE